MSKRGSVAGYTGPFDRCAQWPAWQDLASSNQEFGRRSSPLSHIHVNTATSFFGATTVKWDNQANCLDTPHINRSWFLWEVKAAALLFYCDVDLDGVKNLRWAGWINKWRAWYQGRQVTFHPLSPCCSPAENFKRTHTIPHRNDKKTLQDEHAVHKKKIKKLTRTLRFLNLKKDRLGDAVFHSFSNPCKSKSITWVHMVNMIYCKY